MKKKYVSPEIEVVSLLQQDVLAASKYVPDPETPTRTGVDDPIVDF